MAGEILVALKDCRQTEEVIPYLEKIAQPGMRVIFLLRYPVDGWGWLLRRVADMETAVDSWAVAQEVAARLAFETQIDLARRWILPACEALHRRNIKTVVDVYAGGLRAAVQQYLQQGDVQLVVVPASAAARLKNFLRACAPFFNLFNRPSAIPVLLMHPDHTT